MAVDQPVIPPATFVCRNGTYTMQSSAQQIIPSDPSRLVLLVSVTTTTANIAVYLGGNAGSNFGWILSSGVIYEFTYQKHGPIVWQALWASGQLSSVVIAWQTLSTQ